MLQKVEANNISTTNIKELESILDTFEFSSRENYAVSLLFNIMWNALAKIDCLGASELRRNLYIIFELGENSKGYDFGQESIVNKYLKNKKEPYLLLFNSSSYLIHKINFRGIYAFLKICLQIIDFLEKQNQTSSDLEEMKGRILQILNK